MNISNIANLINAIAVTAGVIFAAVQIRQYQKRRQRDAMNQGDGIACFGVEDHRHLWGRIYPYFVAFEFDRHLTWRSSHVHFLDESKIRAKRGAGGQQEKKNDSFHRRVLVATAGIGKSYAMEKALGRNLQARQLGQL